MDLKDKDLLRDFESQNYEDINMLLQLHFHGCSMKSPDFADKSITVCTAEGTSSSI